VNLQTAGPGQWKHAVRFNVHERRQWCAGSPTPEEPKGL